MRNHKVIVFALFLIFAMQPQILNGQKNSTNSSQENIDTTRDFFAAYPFVFYLPETRWGFGGAAVYTFRPERDSISRTSNIQLGGAYTLNKQLLTYISYNILLDRDRWLLRGELGYYDYFYPYFGIGPDTDRSNSENFFVRFPRLRAIFMRKFFGKTYIGGQAIWDDYDIHEIEEGGLLDRERPEGFDGSDIVGLGLAIQVDHRDQQFYPRKGIFSDLRWNFYEPWMGSSSSYYKVTAHLTHYQQVWERYDHILVMQLAAFYSGGEVPFQELSLWGGPKFGRGYTPGRYRDRAMGLVQAEYRFPVYWRFKAVVFGSLGGVNNDWMNLMEYPIWNLGGGLRFLLSKKDQLHMRLDYGRSGEGGEFYLTVGEAF